MTGRSIPKKHDPRTTFQRRQRPNLVPTVARPRAYQNLVVTYPPSKPVLPVGHSAWDQALCIEGRVYLPQSLDFCLRVTVQQNSRMSDRSARPTPVRIRSPPLCSYEPVPYHFKVTQVCTSQPPSDMIPRVPTTTRTPPHNNLPALQRELRHTLLREQFRAFLQDCQQNHPMADEYDPEQPYYQRENKRDEYDPEDPYYK